MQRKVRGFLIGTGAEERGARYRVGKRGQVRSSGERHALSDARISSVGVDAGAANVSWEWPEALDGAESIMPPGFYPSFVGTRFEMDEESGEVKWVAPSVFVPIRIPNEAPPKRFSSRIVLKNLKGKAGLLVHEQDEIVALKAEVTPGTQYQIFRNVATGMYEIDITTGSIETLRYWTAEDPRANQQGPLPEDSIPLAARELLDAKRLSQIAAVMAVPPALRLMKILETWPKEFLYSDDPEANEQFEGGSIEVVVAKMLNMAKGTCNGAASDCTLYAREATVAARYRGGWVVKSEGTMGTHASVLLNDGQNWLPYDPTVDARRETPKRQEGGQRPEGTTGSSEATGRPIDVGQQPSVKESRPQRVNTQLPDFPPETPAEVQRSATAEFQDWLGRLRAQGSADGSTHPLGAAPNARMAAGLQGLLESLEASGLGRHPRSPSGESPASPIDFGSIIQRLMESMTPPDPEEVARLAFAEEGEEYAALLNVCGGNLEMAKACLLAMQSERAFAVGIPTPPSEVVMPESSILDEPPEEDLFSRLQRAIALSLEEFNLTPSLETEGSYLDGSYEEEGLLSRLERAIRRFLTEV
jgi:transglutaminase-like putative cysteine protease